MSWYINNKGRKVWIERDELVYTVDEPEEESLVTETLTYLAANSSKAVYAEHIIDEDGGGARKTKTKERQAGRQRGFVVRVDHDDRSRLHPALRDVVDKLMQSGIVSKVDVDEGGREGKKKRSGGGGGAAGAGAASGSAVSKPDEALPAIVPLGVNECRVSTVARCQHNAHGVGFRVEISGDGSHQRVNMFTASKQIPACEWCSHLVGAIESTGLRVMMGRMMDSEEPCKDSGKKKQDEARQDEDQWLESVLGRCMVNKAEKDKAEAEGPQKPEQGRDADGEEAGATGEVATAGAADEASKQEKKPAQLPPWLRRR